MWPIEVKVLKGVLMNKLILLQKIKLLVGSQFYLRRLNTFWNKQLRYGALVLNIGRVIYAYIQYFFFLTQGQEITLVSVSNVRVIILAQLEG